MSLSPPPQLLPSQHRWSMPHSDRTLSSTRELNPTRCIPTPDSAQRFVLSSVFLQITPPRCSSPSLATIPAVDMQEAPIMARPMQSAQSPQTNGVNGPRTYQCAHCSKAFARKAHMLRHQSQRMFCEPCTTQFADRTARWVSKTIFLPVLLQDL